MLEIFNLPSLAATSVLAASLIMWWFAIEWIFRSKKNPPEKEKSSARIDNRCLVVSEADSSLKTAKDISTADHTTSILPAAHSNALPSSAPAENPADLALSAHVTGDKPVTELKSTNRQTAATANEKPRPLETTNLNSESKKTTSGPKQDKNTTTPAVAEAKDNRQSLDFKTKPQSKPRLKMRFGMRSAHAVKNRARQNEQQDRQGKTHELVNPESKQPNVKDTPKPSYLHAENKTTRNVDRQRKSDAVTTNIAPPGQSADNKQPVETQKAQLSSTATSGNKKTNPRIAKTNIQDAFIAASKHHTPKTAPQKTLSGKSVQATQSVLPGAGPTAKCSSKGQTKPALKNASLPQLKNTSAIPASRAKTTGFHSEQHAKKTIEPSIPTISSTSKTNAPVTQSKRSVTPATVSNQQPKKDTKLALNTVSSVEVTSNSDTPVTGKKTTVAVAGLQATPMSSTSKRLTNSEATRPVKTKSATASTYSVLKTEQSAENVSREKSTNHQQQTKTAHTLSTKKGHSTTDLTEPTDSIPAHNNTETMHSTLSAGETKNTVDPTSKVIKNQLTKPKKQSGTAKAAKYQTAAKAQSAAVRSEASIQIQHPATQARTESVEPGSGFVNSNRLQDQSKQADKKSTLTKTATDGSNYKNTGQSTPQPASNAGEHATTNNVTLLSSLPHRKQSADSSTAADQSGDKTKTADNINGKSTIELAMERQSENYEPETDEELTLQKTSRDNVELRTKLVASERKVASLQSSLNHWQHDKSHTPESLTSHDTAKTSTHNRPTLLSKVRVLDPADV